MTGKKVKSIELVIATVLIIFLIIMFLVIPLSRARKCEKFAICASNLKQIGFIIHIYTQDYEGYLPPAYCQSSDKYWFEILDPYISKNISPKQKENLLVCPLDKNHIWRGTNYIYNGYYGFFSDSGYPKNLAYKPRKLSDFKHPEDTILLMDGKPDINPIFTYENYLSLIDERHKNICGGKFLLNVLYVDGGVKASNTSKFSFNQLYGY
jgi:hypothetical protein